MGYPIITPSFYKELVPDVKNPASGPKCDVIMSASAVEYIFSLSEIEVVRKLMSISEPLQFNMAQVDNEITADFTKKSAEKIAKYPFLEYYWQIKTLIINVLQKKNIVFEKRMLILNYCMKAMNDMIEQGRSDLIPKFAHEITSAESFTRVLEYFKTLKPLFEASLAEGMAFLGLFKITPEFKKVMDQVYKNLGVSGPETLRDLDINKYITLKKDFVTSEMKDKEHYIENIMINYVFNLSIPFASNDITIWDNYVFMCMLYNAIKIMLTCYMPEKSDDDFAEAITLFDKALREQIPGIIPRVINASKLSGQNNNGDMAIIVVS